MAHRPQRLAIQVGIHEFHEVLAAQATAVHGAIAHETNRVVAGCVEHSPKACSASNVEES